MTTDSSRRYHGHGDYSALKLSFKRGNVTQPDFVWSVRTPGTFQSPHADVTGPDGIKAVLASELHQSTCVCLGRC